MKLTLTDTEAYFTAAALDDAIAAQVRAAETFSKCNAYSEPQRAALARSCADRAQVLQDVRNRLDV